MKATDTYKPNSLLQMAIYKRDVHQLIKERDALVESLKQCVNALEAYHREQPEGEGLAYPMMSQARAALALVEGDE